MTNVTQFPLRRSPEVRRGNTSTAAVARNGGRAPTHGESALDRTFHFWRGMSGQRYVHIVHDLFECPELGATNYILVRIDAGGQRTPLRIGRTTSAHGSENLAQIRMHAARLGACEVHLHVLAETAHSQAVVQWDLQAAHFGAITGEDVAEPQKKTVGA